MSSKKDFTKEIIEEYNIHLQSWGNSDSWGLTEFKMLEDLIYKSSKMRINANTLKRFFQQRTPNPQIATTNALCVFLGYSDYSEFVIKHTQKSTDQQTDLQEESNLNEKKTEEINQNKSSQSITENNSNRKMPVKKYTVGIIIAGIIVAIILFWGKINAVYKDYLISNIKFSINKARGSSPLTVKFEYYIPSQLFDSIYVEFKESNGEIVHRKLKKDQHEIFKTYIYTGKGSCQLKYGNKVIKTIYVDAFASGWSAYLNEDPLDFYCSIPFEDVTTSKGYISLPKEKIPEKADTEKLFVSYTYYNPNIIDGDNFIYEARVRNSVEDHGIPCYDIMLYALSDSLLHCFSLNENCYSYLKFISSENTITGDNQDLSWLKFNPAYWHIMRIEVINKQTSFYLDNNIVLKIDYEKPVGPINALTLRFKGCGAVDYVKVMDLKHKVVYENSFDSVSE